MRISDWSSDVCSSDLSKAKLIVHPQSYAGRSSTDKRREIADWLFSKKADAVVLSALDSIAWTLNVRGQDVDRTPVALAYAIIHADATADLYVAPEKLADDVVAHLGNAVRVHDRADFASDIASFAGKRIAADPERAVAAIFDRLGQGGADVLEMREPAVMPKDVKKRKEIKSEEKTSKIKSHITQ